MPSLSWNCTADSVFLHAKIIGFIMLNRSNMYKMLAGLLLCLTSCNADPLKTFEVYVREDFILSEKPVAEFYGEVYGSISNSHFSIAYSTDEQSLKSDDYRQREEVHVAFNGLASGSYSVMSKELEPDKTYYYCWCIHQAGAGYYYGETKQFRTCHPYSFPTELDMAAAEDLSSAASANCYIVSKPGLYKFKAVKGNSDDMVGEVASSSLLWETFGTRETPAACDIINATWYEDGYIAFETSEQFREGNASIAARDEDGNILWSWHIWLTDPPCGQVFYNDAGTMMDRNLGATSLDHDDVTTCGLVYQWGRKDPFMGSASLTSTLYPASTSASWPEPLKPDLLICNIEYATSHPMQFIMGYGWHFYYDGNGFAGGLWTTSGSPKSIYDPCPAGWRVPDGGPDGVFAKASGETYKALVEVIARRGVDLSGKFGDDSCIWYPFAGFRDPYDGGFDWVGCQGFFWTATLGSDPDAAYVVSFSGSDTGVVWLGDKYACSHGCSVRCVKE